MIRKMYYLSTLLGLTLLLMTGCSEGDPDLKVEPNELDFGTEETQKYLTIQNVGDDDGIFKSGVETLEYDIGTYNSWISSSPTSGESDGEEDNIAVTIDRTSLNMGDNTGEIDVTSNGGNSSVIVRAEKEQTVTGYWSQSWILGEFYFVGYYNLVQNGTQLTGDFVFSDGSGYTTLHSSSSISGQNINIVWYLTNGVSYKMSFIGTVSYDFNSMSGDLYVDDIYWMCSWTAQRISAPSKVIIATSNDNLLAETLLNILSSLK